MFFIFFLFFLFSIHIHSAAPPQISPPAISPPQQLGSPMMDSVLFSCFFLSALPPRFNFSYFSYVFYMFFLFFLFFLFSNQVLGPTKSVKGKGEPECGGTDKVRERNTELSI